MGGPLCSAPPAQLVWGIYGTSLVRVGFWGCWGLGLRIGLGLVRCGQWGERGIGAGQCLTGEVGADSSPSEVKGGPDNPSVCWGGGEFWNFVRKQRFFFQRFSQVGFVFPIFVELSKKNVVPPTFRPPRSGVGVQPALFFKPARFTSRPVRPPFQKTSVWNSKLITHGVTPPFFNRRWVVWVSRCTQCQSGTGQ